MPINQGPGTLFGIAVLVIRLRLRKSIGRMTIMHTANNRLALLTSVIAIGLLMYSPVCSLSCAASDCSLLPKSKVAKQNKPSSHCHQRQDSEEQPAKSHQNSNAPEPHRDSGDCPTHTDAVAILSSAAKAPAVVQQSLQPGVAALPETSYVSFDGFVAKFVEGRPFRSPPKRAVISVYRI